jgi:geranylgeranyl pyrophosphate synthase
MLGGPLDDDRLAAARALITANGSIEAALAVARDHAQKASEALSGADGLDPVVTTGLCRLVDGLVTRDR